MSELALFGGQPVLSEPLPLFRSMGEAEKQAVIEVMDSGIISGFYGSPGPEFLGGPRVQAFEAAWANSFNVPYAISVNSATSGLYAAMGAIGLEPGDEVIVPPYTMSATVMAPLVYGGIPIFADIEPETYGLDPAQVAAQINPRTRAVIAVNLFGHPARLHALKQLCERHDLYLIEDNAQAPFASENQIYTGTIGDIGVFSLNYHKHLHTGEGGICVTHNPQLAERLQLIRNHGENIVESRQLSPAGLIGFNYRLTELQAAIGLKQLERQQELIAPRQQLAEALSEAARATELFQAPVVRENCQHVYYVWVTQIEQTGFSPELARRQRELISRALTAEGFPNSFGYVKPLYHLPVFQQKQAWGQGGFPFSLAKRQLDYQPGLCPVAEKMHQQTLLGFEPCMYAVTPEHQHQLQTILLKLDRHRAELEAHLEREAL
jgi:perosamine synthetase